MNDTFEPDLDPDNAAVANAEPTLTPQLGARWALQAKHAVYVGIGSAAFLLLSYLPLRSPELWGRVVVGDWILSARELPSEEPMMALSEGMPIWTSTWLSEVTLAAVSSIGDEWLTVLFAVTILVTFLILAHAFYLRSRDLDTAMVMTALVGLVSWSSLTMFQPEHLAGVCMATLLWLLASDRPDGRRSTDDATATEVSSRQRSGWWMWLGVPAVMCLWVNLDRSFVWGLAILLCSFLGEAITAWWRSGSLAGMASQATVRRSLYLLELGLVATLFNPNGLDQLLGVFWFEPKENVAGLVAGQPLVVLAAGGRVFALSVVLILLIFRHSRRSVSVADALMLAVFALATVYQRGAILWYAPVLGYVLAPHVAGIWARLRKFYRDQRAAAAPGSADDPEGSLEGFSWVYSLLCLLFIWVAFSLSGLSRPLLGGRSRTPAEIYGQELPLALATQLKRQVPQGQLFNPYEWGDWLQRQEPELKVFATSRVENIPRRVWQDYGQVATASAGWQRVLDRYRVTHLIADKQQQQRLIGLVRLESDWQVGYEDHQAIVFRRARPTTTRQDASAVSGVGEAESADRQSPETNPEDSVDAKQKSNDAK